MKLKIWELALIFAVATTMLTGALIEHDSEELSDKLIRLHVVANSDTDADQALKLKVRDAVLDALSPSLKGITDADEAQGIIEGKLGYLESVARDTMSAEGYEYEVTAAICEESFPTTEYDTFALPAGEYTALRITIGAGAGHNWWCVVFPPVCSSAVLDKAAAAAIGLSEDEISLITTDSTGYVVKFRFMEILGKLKFIFK